MATGDAAYLFSAFPMAFVATDFLDYAPAASSQRQTVLNMSLHDDFQNMALGDIFHAKYPAMGGGSGSAICLVIGKDAETITARTVTTHWNLIFDRKTLIGRHGDGERNFIVTSAKPLPDNVHGIMLELDRKFDPATSNGDPTLSRAQKDALVFVADHFNAAGVGSERAKMAAGEWYTCIDDELEELRAAARDAVFEHNSLPPRQRGDIGPALRALLGGASEGARIEAPFHCAYGFNLFLGEGVFLNAGCTILDTAPVRIGKGTLLGPNVQIYCAEHHREAAGRRAGLEIAKPVTIGTNAWIGGGAVILGGVSIGEGAIVGAGAVVTSDVAANTTVVGNPARAITRR